jgi:transposase-like protein
MKTPPASMNASQQFCPNKACKARGKIGQGNIVIHSRSRPRYLCQTCGKTFSAKEGTMFAGLRKPTELIVIVVTLLAYGCPVQAIVHAFGLDERTVASWRERAGKHCELVHRALVEQGQLDLVHVQADEIRVKGHKMIAWMGLAVMVSTRLWLAGTVSVTRDRLLAERLMQQVRACAQAVRPILVCTDGWVAYPGSIRRAKRREGQSATWPWPGRFVYLAAVADWDGDQTHGEASAHGYHPSHDAWQSPAGCCPAPSLPRWKHAQHCHN